MWGKGFGRRGGWGWGARLGYCPWTGEPAGRAWGWGSRRGGWRWGGSPPTPEEERQALEDLARHLREQLRWVEERLRSLETSEEPQA